MTDKPPLVVFNEVFGDTLRPAPQPAPPPAPTLATEGEAHTKLQGNLDMSLDVHRKILAGTLANEIPAPGDRRMALEAANTTVKAALATDRTALKARQDNTMELVMLRILFHRYRRGMEIKPEDEERLRTAPRAKLETALGPRQMIEYDALKW